MMELISSIIVAALIAIGFHFSGKKKQFENESDELTRHEDDIKKVQAELDKALEALPNKIADEQKKKSKEEIEKYYKDYFKE